MPITPLHLGVLAPLNHFFPNRVSNISFLLITLWLDGNAILYYAFGLDAGELHGANTHSFLGAFVLSSIVALCGILSLRWVLGAYIGGITHVFLDALVHAEMDVLAHGSGNPLFIAGMEPVSWLLIPFLIWFIGQSVTCTLAMIRKHLAGIQP